MNWKRIIINSSIMLLILSPIIMAELIINLNRHRDYNDPYHEDIEFHSEIITSEEVDLQIWYSNYSDTLVILVHGHYDNSGLMYDRYADFYLSLGYDVLMLDLRNHGLSGDAKPVMMGISEYLDVFNILKWISSKNWSETIVFGTSMGAVSSIVAISEVNETLRPDLLILDSLFSDFEETLDLNLKKNHIPNPWRYLILKYIFNYRFQIQDDFIDILSLISNLDDIPILVLHGSEDIEAPKSILDEIDALNKINIDTVLIENGEHSKLYLQDVYNVYLANFFNKHL